MRILGVCGSLQARSANHDLLVAAARLAPPGVEVVLFDGLRGLPLFNPDIEAEGETGPVRAWRDALADSDAVLIACPEYGHSLPGALKNAVDWIIGSGELHCKVVAVTASVASADRGQLGLQALCQTLRAVDAVIVGGAPTVRGEGFEAQVRALLEALVRGTEAESRPD